MKKFTSLFSAGIILSTMVGGGLTAFADEVTPEEPTSSVVDTKKTPVTATFELPTNGGENPSVPGDPDDNDNTNNNSDQAFAIAYQPKEFNFGTTKLKDKGEQVISSTNTKTYHVGVKDKRRKNEAWNLNAVLEWTGANKDQMTGTTIKVSGASVKKNVNGNLEGQANPDGVSGSAEFTLGTSSTNVMTASAQQRNDVYDDQLTNVQLVIPEAGNVAAGTYNGTVTWTLESAPK
ncbi:WxL domain-containing protein [Enterococcus faecium]|uniref:WxL domain-containing protein n=1 Tax=Enterococcus faecium TaxID=1352 RepID=UPI00397D3FEF